MGYTRTSPVRDFQYVHVAGAATAQPIGKVVGTTASTAVGAAGPATITPASMANVVVGQLLAITGGTGTAENVRVTAVTATTFTATFANTHSGTYNISSINAGTFLEGIIVGNAGTTGSVTIYDGNPNGPGSKTFSVLSLSSSAPYINCGVELKQGLFVTISGTGTDVTFLYDDAFRAN